MARRTGTNSPRPTVGVTGNAKWCSLSWICIRIAVRLAGGRAKRISVRHSYSIEQLDALIVSGGDDIHPSLYEGEIMPKAHYDPARDALEQIHIAYALQNRLPMLGICRGTQLINVTKGGTLYSDIRPLRKRTSNRGTVLARKTALLLAASCLASTVSANRLRINSLHHQAINSLGENVAASAKDLDGFIQAIEPRHDCHWLGVQWHPEYLIYKKQHRRLFKWLVDQCKQPPLPI